MYRVTEIIEFPYGHRLLNYRGACANLHGHNGKAEIVVAAAALDERSMVADFLAIGRIAREFIDGSLAHRMLLHRDDPLVEVLRAHDQPLFTMEGDPTAEGIARLIYDHVAAAGLAVCEVRLWETGTSVASYAPGRR
jgi:6-pyruvoyltetrahydropterin/6-carboxytetrahydropterin synthase